MNIEEQKLLEAIKGACRVGPSQKRIDLGFDMFPGWANGPVPMYLVMYTVFQSGSQEEKDFLSDDETPKWHTILGREESQQMVINHVLITPDESGTPWVKYGDIPPLR